MSVAVASDTSVVAGRGEQAVGIAQVLAAQRERPDVVERIAAAEHDAVVALARRYLR